MNNLKSFQLIPIVFVITMPSVAQNFHEYDAMSIGQGSISTIGNHPWTAFNNPANLTLNDRINLGVIYSSPFNISELSNQSLAISLPMKNSGIGVGIHRFGYELYNENTLFIGYVMKLMDGLSVGMSLYHFQTTIGNKYGRRSNVSSSFGTKVRWSEKIDLYFTIRNLLNSVIEDYHLERPGTIQFLALRTSISDQVERLAEIEKQSLFPARFKVAVCYAPSKSLKITFGSSTEPVSPSAGIHLYLGRMLFVSSWRYDFNRGVQPSLSLVYRSKGK